MPIHEFKCREGHVTERLFLTFDSADRAQKVFCDVCRRAYPGVWPLAKRVEFSVPGQAILLGDGFHKPAASGRFQTKGADPSKAAKEFLGEIGGAQGLVKAVKGSK